MGKDLAGDRIRTTDPVDQADGDAFRVITGDFVTTDDGTTGIVHIAPTFGADDDRVARQNGIAPLMVTDRAGKRQPMVDRTGKFFLIADMDPEFGENPCRYDCLQRIRRPFRQERLRSEADGQRSDARRRPVHEAESSRTKYSRSKSTRTTIRIAGVPINRCCTTRWTRGSSKRRPSKTG